MNAQAIQFVTTSDGVSIACAVSGEGAPFIATPDSFSHVQLFSSLPSLSRWYRSMASRCRFVRYDHRGQGMSARDLPRIPTAADYEADLQAVVERVADTPVVLYGTGIFAYVAVTYAAHHPERVRALILWRPILERRGAMAVSSQIATDDWDYFVATAAQNGLPLEDSVLVRRIFKECFTREDFLQFHRATSTFSAPSLPRDIRVPALVLTARDEVSAIPVEEAARQAAALLPNSRLQFFDDPGWGRVANQGNAAPLELAIDAFLAELPVSEPPTRGITAAGAAAVNLSDRELEVLRLLAIGRTNPQIAEQLVISPNTVAKHVSSILAKTGANNRVEAAVYARDHGLV